MSKIEVNAIEPQTGTTLTLGASGDTITIPAGATISNSGTATGFSRNGVVNWDTTAKTTGFTAVSGVGYFCNTTSGAFTVTLPATPTAGDVVGICDYANTFATNNITVGRNGSKIAGSTTNAVLSTNGVSVTFVYVDATQGWIVTDSGNRSDLPQPTFIVATGGTVLTCGNYKTHVFTGPGTFTVCSVGNSLGSNSVDYLVVAGGGGAYRNFSAGSGAGGFRVSNFYGLPAPTTSPLASSTSLPVSATGYPITVGAGGSPGPSAAAGGATAGSNSIFSTITSAGGGRGGSSASGPGGTDVLGESGGSGGGGDYNSGKQTAGSGNTPPVSPSQGNPGGNGSLTSPTTYGSGGGGGAGAAAANLPGTANGGIGSFIDNTFLGPTAPSYGTSGPVASTRYFSGGGAGFGSPISPTASGGSGGGGSTSSVNGSTNTGGGGSGVSGGSGAGGAGGSGIVVIRYKFQ